MCLSPDEMTQDALKRQIKNLKNWIKEAKKDSNDSDVRYYTARKNQFKDLLKERKEKDAAGVPIETTPRHLARV